MVRLSIIACLAALAIAGARHPAAAQSGTVTVFAAASLKTALDAIAADWRKETGKQATVSYGASPALAKQIEHGAPADLFISADEDWMDYLQQRNLIDPQSRVDLLGNTLVLIAAKDSTAQVSLAPAFPLATLLGDGRLAVCDPDSVPAGKYGKAALTKLGVWPSVAGRLAIADNVRAALVFVARGEAPFGIVYQTDAAVEPAVRVVATFPADLHPPIVYPLALANTSQPDAAAFAAYLRGSAARARFEEQGFAVLDHAR